MFLLWSKPLRFGFKFIVLYFRSYWNNSWGTHAKSQICSTYSLIKCVLYCIFIIFQLISVVEAASVYPFNFLPSVFSLDFFSAFLYPLFCSLILCFVRSRFY